MMKHVSQRNLISPFPSERIGIHKDVRGLLERDKRQKMIRVRFAARSQFTAILSNTRRDTNVNLEILDSQNRIVAASRRLANQPERIDLQKLAPGTYFVKPVLARGQWSRFRLRVNTTPIPDSGNEASTARFLDVTATELSVDEFVGAEDSSDYYSFKVGDIGLPTGQLRLHLSGPNGNLLNGNLNVKIRDSQLRVVRQQTSTGRIGFSWDEPLAAGTYFIQVTPDRSALDQTDYRLTLSTTNIPDLAGNTPNAARAVTLDSTDSIFRDFVGTGDSQDYYKFTLPNSRFNLQLTGPNGNLLNGEVTVRLRDQVNAVLEQQTVSGGAGISIDNRSLAAGTYRIQISTTAKLVNYQLLMTATPAP